MAPATRGDNARALQHLLKEVVEIVDTDPLALALVENGVTKITNLLVLDEETIRAFTYTSDEETIPLLRAQTVELFQAIQFYKSLRGPNTLVTWLEMTAGDFATWLTASEEPAVPTAPPPTEPVLPTTPPGPVVTTPASTPMPAVDAFNRQIRRNPSDFIAFKKDSDWLAWSRAMLATSTAQGVQISYYPTYAPNSDEDKALFKAINQYNYSVLVNVVQTTFGRRIVRQFESTLDAQGVYRLLANHYGKGVTADICAQSLEEEILAMPLDDKYRKGCENFLNIWVLKVQELDSIRETVVPDSQKRSWLTTTLQPHTSMYAAIVQASTMEHTLASLQKSKVTVLDFEQFFELCLTTAKHIDKHVQVTNKKTREVNSARGTKPATPRAGTTTPGPKKSNYIEPAQWAKMTPEAQQKHREKCAAARAATQTTKVSRKANAAATKAAAATAAAAAAASAATAATVSTVTASTAPPPIQDVGLREMLSNTANRSLPSEFSMGGHTWRMSNHTNIQYHVQSYELATGNPGSLIDGGANGGFAGSDVRLIELTNDFADVSGIGTSVIKDLAIGTVAGLIDTTSGPIIGIFHQYAYHGKGKTIHAPNQLRAFDIEVNDVPLKSPCGRGKQEVVTPEGYHIPIKIRQGLPYMNMSAPTDLELDSFPHVIFTSDEPWDPTVFDDQDDDDDPNCGDKLEIDPLITQFGKATQRESHGQVLHKHSPNLEAMRPYFGWTPLERIKHTLDATTQYARADTRLPMRKHFKTRFPAANVSRLDDVVATDTFFSDTPAHDDGIMGHGGATMVQLYTGVATQFTKAYPMAKESEMPGTLEDFIREIGAPNSLFSDNSKVQIGSQVRNILRMYAISNFQCEPHHQHQNPAERKIQEVKKLTNAVMDRTGTQAKYWLLCLLFVVTLMNHLATASLNWETPTYKATGQRPDISKFIVFHFNELVLYAVDNVFPSASPEKEGFYMGPAEHAGDILTHLILTKDTEQVITRSAVRKATDASNLNLRAKACTPTEDGETQPALKSTSDLRGLDIDPSVLMLPKLSPEELMGLTFIRESDGQKLRAKVIRKINDDDAANHQNIQFLVEVGNGDVDEIIAYAELSALVEAQREEELLNPDKAWIYKAIIGHEGPLNVTHPKYKGSVYNVLVQWEDGSETYEPLALIKKDDPVTCATYAKDNNLLDLPGWKSLKRIATRNKLYKRMVKQAKMSSERNGPYYKFGVRVPRSKADARKLDEEAGNTKWRDAEIAELTQLDEYETFEDQGKLKSPPKGYKFIRVHFVYDCKHDLRRKARMVAGGHMTTPMKDDSYSGVVSLRSIRICLLLGELNGLKVGVGDVGNAYLEAYTQEKVYIIAGPEFGELAGHTLIIRKALYGLRTSGARYHEKFAATLTDMGFRQSYADPDVWMREQEDHWEYIAVYVDDLMAIMKDPDEFFKLLVDKYKYKLKGTGPPKYHLGGDFFRDDDGILGWGAQTYIKKL